MVVKYLLSLAKYLIIKGTPIQTKDIDNSSELLRTFGNFILYSEGRKYLH